MMSDQGSDNRDASRQSRLTPHPGDGSDDAAPADRTAGDVVEESGQESFPASDAPGWIQVVIGAPEGTAGGHATGEDAQQS